MWLVNDRNLQALAKALVNDDFLEYIPPKNKMHSAWEFVDVSYNKSTADPVTIEIWFHLNDQFKILLLTKINMVELDWYFQINKRMPAGISLEFKTIGAPAAAFEHKFVMLYH